MSGFDYRLTYFNVQTENQEQLTRTLDDRLSVEWTYPFYYKRTQDKGQVKYQLQTEISEKQQSSKEFITGYRLNFANRYPNMRAIRRQGGIILFVSLFVGVIVLITTSSSLIVRQFSNTEREKEIIVYCVHSVIAKRNSFDRLLAEFLGFHARYITRDFTCRIRNQHADANHRESRVLGGTSVCRCCSRRILYCLFDYS